MSLHGGGGRGDGNRDGDGVITRFPSPHFQGSTPAWH